MKTSKIKLFTLFFVIAASFFVVGHKNAFAATLTWDAGGDGSTWSDGDNWSTNAVPVDGDGVVIACSTGSCNTIMDITGLELASISFTGAGQGYIDTNTASPYTLTVAGNISSVFEGSVITNALTLGADVTSDNVQLGAVNLNSHKLTLTGSGYLRANGDGNPEGPGGWIGIGGPITGAGTLDIAADSDQEVYLGCSNDSTYTGTTNIISGLFVSNGCSNIISGEYLGISSTSIDKISLFGDSVVNVGPQGKIRFTVDQTDNNATVDNVINLDRTGGTEAQLEFYNHSTNNSAVTINFPNIELESFNRFAVNTDAGNILVNLVGITANGYCVEYGDANNSQAANFQNGADCVDEPTPTEDIPVGIGSTGRAPHNMAGYLIGAIVMLGVGFKLVRRKLLNQ